MHESNAAADMGDTGVIREEATLVDVVFRSPTGPWMIGLFRRVDGTVFQATGNFGHSVLFEEFILHGELSPNVPGGDFDVRHFTSMPPKAVASLAGYLSALTGASRSSSVKLVQCFGENSIDVLERSPERLFDADIPEKDIEKLRNGWIELRSNKLALAQVDIEGISPNKLSKLQRTLGYNIDLNARIKEDPYLLYVQFDDMLFTSAINLARRLGVPNASVSAVKGAVVATLRKEAWLGHSFVEGKPLIEACMKLLALTRQVIQPLIGDAVKELVDTGFVKVSESRVQLSSLHRAEHELISLGVEWSQFDSEELDDIEPSEDMGLKLIKPMKLKANAAKPLVAGMCSLLQERFALVQCETVQDQLMITTALDYILRGFGTDTIFVAYTCEMVDEAVRHLGEDASVFTYAEMIGLDPDTGVPAQGESSPVTAEVIVLIGADSIGIEEMTCIMHATPQSARIYMLGCPKDMPSLTVGQPFAEMVRIKDIRCFQGSFWLPKDTGLRNAHRQVWAGTLTPDLDDFDPTSWLSWFRIERDHIPAVLPELVIGLAEASEIDPLNDIQIVTPTQKALSSVDEVCQWLVPQLSERILGGYETGTFQAREYVTGLPVVIRQPITSAKHPAFSVFTPTEVTFNRLTLVSRNRGEITVDLTQRIDVFPAAVMTPKFVRGRIYDYVVLVVLKEHHGLITQELITTLLNTARKSLVIVGEIEDLGSGLADRPGLRARSKLPQWIKIDVD